MSQEIAEMFLGKFYKNFHLFFGEISTEICTYKNMMKS